MMKYVFDNKIVMTVYFFILLVCNNDTIAFASTKPLSTQIFTRFFSSLPTFINNNNRSSNTSSIDDYNSRPEYVLEKIRQQQEYNKLQEEKQQQQQQQQQSMENGVGTTTTTTTTKNDNEPFMYYFGVGSNMLRSKIENRGVNGTTINLLHMEPAIVYGHRLAFNMRGFPPIEPGMGSLEPTNTISKAIYPYQDGTECHGALVKVTVDNYEKIMRSEGVGYTSNDTASSPFGSIKRRSNVGYEEIIVTAVPYNTSNEPVIAIALRAKSGSRLVLDANPSERYMSILQNGASELGLIDTYKQYLINHPKQFCPKIIRLLAIYNFLYLSTVSTILFKSRIINQIQSWLLFRVYVRSYYHGTNNKVQNVLSKIKQIISLTLTTIILLPGASIGGIIATYLKVFNKPLPRMIQMLAKSMDNQNSTNTTTTTSSSSNSTTSVTTESGNTNSAGTGSDDNMTISTTAPTIIATANATVVGR